MLSRIIVAGLLIVSAIFAAVRIYWPEIIAQPPSAAAFLGALVGAGGGLLAIIIGALLNAELNRRRDDRLRREEGRALALALRGEMLSIADVFRRCQANLHKSLENLAKYAHLKTYQVYTTMGCSITIFSKTSGHLGLLEDSDLIADLAQFYTGLPKEDKHENMAPAEVPGRCQQCFDIADMGKRRAENLAKQLQAAADSFAPRP